MLNIRLSASDLSQITEEAEIEPITAEEREHLRNWFEGDGGWPDLSDFIVEAIQCIRTGEPFQTQSYI